jgi:glucokinase
MRVLVGDIGGTKTGLAVAEVVGDAVTLAHEMRCPSRDYATLADIVQRYLSETGAHCDVGSFAIAGPVVAGRSKTTNLPWNVDAEELAGALRLERAHLLNDLEAIAWGVAALSADDLAEIQAGEPAGCGNA